MRSLLGLFFFSLAASGAAFSLSRGIREGTLPVSRASGSIEHKTVREYQGGLIAAAVVLGLIAIGILLSGM